jgi:hypothetical protein
MFVRLLVSLPKGARQTATWSPFSQLHGPKQLSGWKM